MRYRQESDEVLVARVLCGENNAYEELVFRHQKNVLARALAVTHNEFMAEDAAQDAFVTAWMKLDMLREPEKFGAWVCRIARNRAVKLVERFREYADYDDSRLLGMESADAADTVFISEERAELRHAVERLPAKIRTVIYLHYFEGLTVAEIAAKMNAPSGTVKWQLSEGRKKLRGDLSAMSEKETDTLVEKVMKKVAELRLWRLRSDLMGFEEALRDVMSDIDRLPESKDKNFALADALLQGWLYRPGYKNDEAFARIKETSLLGHNEEAMQFVVMHEGARVSGDDFIEYTETTQIPFLQKHGFARTEGAVCLKLSYAYLDKGDAARGIEVLDRAMGLCAPENAYYALAIASKKAIEQRERKYIGRNRDSYGILVNGVELRTIGGDLCLWNYPKWTAAGDLYGMRGNAVFSAGSMCDNRFYIDGADAGYTYRGSDGSTLTFVSDSASVSVPAGDFDGCEVWISEYPKELGHVTRYYKHGVGIVKQDATVGIYDFSYELSSYAVCGGDGRLPIAKGNKWEYVRTDDVPFSCTETYEVVYSDAGRATLSALSSAEKKPDVGESWGELLFGITGRFNSYDTELGERHIGAVKDKLARLLATASTPYETTLSRMVCDMFSAIGRDIKCGARCWDHLMINAVERYGDVVRMDKMDDIHSFSWIHGSVQFDAGEYKLLHNMVLDILDELAGCLWSDKWLSGEAFRYDLREDWKNIGSTIVCRPVGETATAAGIFLDCVEVSIVDTEFVQSSGWGYRGGVMEYTFAPGVGVIRAVHHYTRCGTDEKSVYELSSYIGTGEGYMPVADGMRRRYECVNIGASGTASAEYAFVTAPNGSIAVITALYGSTASTADESGEGRLNPYYQLRDSGL